MSKPRIYQQSNWRVVIAIAVVFAWCAVVASLWPGRRNDGVLIGALSYLIVARLLRHWVLRYGRRGIKAGDAERYDEAIEHFRKSEQFFRSHSWVDKWRTIIAQSTSTMSLLELALMNIVASQLSAGRPDEARQSLEAMLHEFPDNELAKGTLKTWELMQRTPVNASQVP